MLKPALRWEDYGGNIGGDLSPKVALVGDQPTTGCWVLTLSRSAPNIGVVNQAFEAFGTSVQDLLRNQQVRAGLLPATDANAIQNSSYTSGAPNPFLGNETADTYNLGFQWTSVAHLKA